MFKIYLGTVIVTIVLILIYFKALSMSLRHRGYQNKNKGNQGNLIIAWSTLLVIASIPIINIIFTIFMVLSHKNIEKLLIFKGFVVKETYNKII